MDRLFWAGELIINYLNSKQSGHHWPGPGETISLIHRTQVHVIYQWGVKQIPSSYQASEREPPNPVSNYKTTHWRNNSHDSVWPPDLLLVLWDPVSYFHLLENKTILIRCHLVSVSGAFQHICILPDSGAMSDVSDKRSVLMAVRLEC